MNIQSDSTVIMTRGSKKFTMSFSIIRKENIKLLEAFNSLHISEKKKYEKLKHERRKWSYILGRISAKKAVQTSSKVPFLQAINIDSGVFGFPIVKCLDAKNVQVSITHSKTIGMSIAFEDEHPMGVDIERINEESQKALESQIKPQELALLKEIQRDELTGFTALWCAKEAISKVIKTGMMLDFSFLEIEKINTKGNVLTCEFKNFGQYKAVCYTNKAYAVAIVLPKKTSIELSKVWHIFDLETVLFKEGYQT